MSDGSIHPGTDPKTGETIDLVSAYQVAGHPDAEYRHHIACHACPGIGSCGGMFTYNTMQTFIGVSACSRCTWWRRRPTIRAGSRSSRRSWSVSRE
jgi:dihydroxyacid dehydratase/phosphogluconate dehydratase